MSSTRKKVRALLVEDNRGDIALTNYSFKDTHFEFTFAKDGVEGLALAKTLLPDIIFLDINMPRMRGDEVLAELKRDPYTWHIPVVMLTSSVNPDHIKKAYSLQCSAYIQKPVTMHKFEKLAATMEGFWVDSVLFHRD